MHVNDGCHIVSIGQRKVSNNCNTNNNNNKNSDNDGDDSRNNNNNKSNERGDLATMKKSRANQQLQRNFIYAANKYTAKLMTCTETNMRFIAGNVANEESPNKREYHSIYHARNSQQAPTKLSLSMQFSL